MVKFILKRIGTMIIAMFMIILITFTLMHSIPGGPFTNTKGVPEEVTQAMEAKYGLDQPMPDRKSTRLNSSHKTESRMPSSA